MIRYAELIQHPKKNSLPWRKKELSTLGCRRWKSILHKDIECLHFFREPFNASTRISEKNDRMLHNFFNKEKEIFFIQVFFAIKLAKQIPTSPPKKRENSARNESLFTAPQVVDPPRPGLHHVVLRALRLVGGLVILGMLVLRDVGSQKLRMNVWIFKIFVQYMGGGFI